MSFRLILSDISEIFTAREDEPLLVGGDLLIAVDDDGMIAFVGKRIDFERRFSELSRYGNVVFSAGGKVVYPGFVESHTHILYAATREDEFEKKARGVSYEQIAAEGGGILHSAERTADASYEEIYRQSEKRLLQLISYGVTTVEMKSGYALTPDGEIRLLKVANELMRTYPITIVSTFLGAHAYPRKYQDDHQGYIDCLVHEMLPRVQEETNTFFVDVFCEKGYFSPSETEQVFRAASDFGFFLKLHSDEFTALGGTELAAEYNAVSVDHLEAVTDSGIAAMKRYRVTPVVLPITSIYSRLPFAPAKKMLDRGLPVALATDFNPGSSMCGFLPLAASVAATQLGLSVEDALRGITLNAAKALRLSEKVGSIEQGKQGDLLIMDAESWTYPVYHMAHNHLVASFSAGFRVDTIARKRLYETR